MSLSINLEMKMHNDSNLEQNQTPTNNASKKVDLVTLLDDIDQGEIYKEFETGNDVGNEILETEKI